MRPVIVLTALLAALNIAYAEQCPLDRVVWKDTKTDRVFAAERAAQHLIYQCGEKFIKTETERAGCGNLHGTFYVDGYMSGQRIYAIFHIDDASPCCWWDSQLAPNAAIEKEVPRWKPVGKAIEITLKDPSLTISDNPPLYQVMGPLGGGNFVAEECRR
ncbi:hypothetical protein [Mesorhizobium sp. M0491]|uniref:hypothetical protein n=1 Tax=Mesorhizobium sp. M0491 TaxID=2956950 RepID=UPI003336A978